ncbi:MAG: flippase-like domain-containing protein, partial [Clostridiales bacterium]|nr:flippase-like domain-containing protein [Clostridiales bacterium]
MKRENIGKLILSLISLLILIELILYVNPSKLIIEIKKIHTEAIFIAFLLANIATLFRVLKWWVLIDNISIKELIPIQLAGMMISNLTPGKVGEPIKAFILKSLKGINVSESLQSIIWERTLDLIVLLIFTLIGIVLFSKLLKFSIVGIFISIIVI